MGNQGLLTMEKRREGYLTALRGQGIAPRPELSCLSDYTMEGGHTAMKRLMNLRERPTAAFITNYEMTLGAMIALGVLGLRAPGNVSVIGFDKLELFDAVYPSLTLVKQPQNAIGECVARQRLSLLTAGGESVPHQIITLSAQSQEGGSVQRLEA